MIDIKSEEELNQFFKDYDTKVLNKQFYEPNIYSYKLATYYYMNRHSYKAADHPGYTFSEDYFHKDHYLICNNGSVIYKTLSISYNHSTDYEYDYDNTDTWPSIYTGNRSNYAYTEDDELLRIKTNRVYSLGSRNIIHTLMTHDELVSKGFIKGKVNDTLYFIDIEIENADKMLPYRKFNNTFGKVDTNYEEKMLRASKMDEASITRRISDLRRQNILMGVESPTYSIFEGITKTFGIEVETCNGRLEEEDSKDLNLKAVFDGSLRDENGETPGAEYVSGVLVGDAGMAQVHEIMRTLANRCAINSLCGVHVHIGLDWDNENIVYMYLLAEKLEQELYAMLPKSRRKNVYCRALTPIVLKRQEEITNISSKAQYNIAIEDIFNDILDEVSYTKGHGRDNLMSSKSYNKNKQHPLGHKCGYDKNTQRYCWLNFITLMYNTKGNPEARTIEIRSHSATLSYNKVKNWIKIFMAMVTFVETNKKDILGNITLAKVLTTVYPKTGATLVKYVEERKELFTKAGESVDYVEKAVPSKKTIKEVTECA